MRRLLASIGPNDVLKFPLPENRQLTIEDGTGILGVTPNPPKEILWVTRSQGGKPHTHWATVAETKAFIAALQAALKVVEDD